MITFRPFPYVAPLWSGECALWLEDAWPGLSDVVRDFLAVDRPWSAVLSGPPGTGKTLLECAFGVLAGGLRRDGLRGVVTEDTARLRLRVRDESPGRGGVSLGHLLYGQNKLHAQHVYGRGEILFVGYGRALETSNAPSSHLSGLEICPAVHFLSAAVGAPRLSRALTADWVLNPDGTPGALVRTLAAMAAA